jgi:hypothetical protein
LSRISRKIRSLLEAQNRDVSATKRATGRRIAKAHTTKGQAHGDLNMTIVLIFVKGTVVSKCSQSPFVTVLMTPTKHGLALITKHFWIAAGCSNSNENLRVTQPTIA